jgi:NADH:ubiquinone oxidoreductase subunit E
MSPATMMNITICMGSSCFSRGNNRNIEVIQGYIQTGKLPSDVHLSGHLCQGHCRSGPNLTLNDKMFHEVNPIALIGLLQPFEVKGPA